MRSFISALATIALLLLLMPGCEKSKSPTEPAPPQNQSSGGMKGTTTIAVLPQTIALQGFTIAYNGRTLANNQTTFSYTVTGPGVDLHFRLELPPCAPALASVSPTGGVTSNNDADINPGIEWHPSTGSASTVTLSFSVTYPGTIREGIVLTSIKTPGGTGVGLIAGACARVFDISGSAFTDANNNGLRDGSETGIANAAIALRNASSLVVGNAVTDANGGYLFSSVPAGTYTVALDTTTVAGTSTRYLGATTPTSITLSVGPDAPGNNFGFAPKTKQLINDLKFGTLPTNGLTPGFWKKQLQSALSGGGNPTVSKDSLLAYIARIRGLLLTEPFQLGTGDGLQAAFDILNRPIKTDLDALTQQVLALEFNWESNHGIISTDPALQVVLMGWGEALVAANQTSSGLATSSVSPAAATTMAVLSDATTVIAGVNKSSGGGGSF